MSSRSECDVGESPFAPHVVVVGAGNAALCAAVAAREEGAKVTVLERAPIAERGGNTAFTHGFMRVAYRGADDLLLLMPDLSERELENTDFGSYPEERFFADVGRICGYRSEPDLVDILVSRSFDTVHWMHEKGVRFVPIYGRQSFKIDGKMRFWGGLAIEAVGGGPGLIDFLMTAADNAGVDVLYERRAVRLLRNDSGVRGVRVSYQGQLIDIPADSVVLACGGFQANTEWRTRYLGHGWDLAKVRGTRFNQGDGIRMALEIGAASSGNWSGCHAAAWDANAPTWGSLGTSQSFYRHSYPFGIVINNDGQRFLDEGADFVNYTYAKYGRVILEQSEQTAWQVFDAQGAKLLRPEYGHREVTVVKADTIEELAHRMAGVDVQGFLRTVEEFNDSIDDGTPFNPTVLDGKGTSGLAVSKSNWATAIKDPPFHAYQVTCGITFTFGGLSIDTFGRVIDDDGAVINGLYAAGELVGGLFYFNYPGGSGLTSGAVFGRLAGASAAEYASG